MKEKLKSKEHNGVWNLVELLEGCNRVSCKWVFKTKPDSHDKIECYNVRLAAKGFTKRNDVEKGFEFEFSTCNRLPYVCNRLPAIKLLKFKFKSHDPSNYNCVIDYTNIVIDYQ